MERSLNSSRMAYLSHRLTITSPAASSSATRTSPRSSRSMAFTTASVASGSPGVISPALLHSSSIVACRSAIRPRLPGSSSAPRWNRHGRAHVEVGQALHHGVHLLVGDDQCDADVVGTGVPVELARTDEHAGAGG